MKLLYVTPEFGWPPSVGGHIRKWNMLQGLLQAGDTDVLVFSPQERVDSPAFAGCRKVIRIDARHARLSEAQRQRYQSTLGRAVMTLTEPLPLEYSGEAQQEMRRIFRRDVDLAAYDLVWFATARSAIPLGKLDARLTVLDGDDFSYVREWHLLRTSSWYGSKLFNYLDVAKLWWWESRFAQRFSYVVRCSPLDATRHPAPNVLTIPNGTHIPADIGRRAERRLLFVGDLAYVPNEQGILWFIEQVWPRIRERVPDAALDVAGRGACSALLAHHQKNGVHIHGFVKDLAALYATAGAAIVPLLAGGGTRLKILESLAHGVPVASTHLGAFGIDADARHGLDRFDAPNELADCCIQFLNDLATADARGARGRELVTEKYDWAKIQQQVAAFVHRVVEQNARR